MWLSFSFLRAWSADFGCKCRVHPWNSGVRLCCRLCTIRTLRFLFIYLCHILQSAFITEDKAAEFRHQVYLPITLTKVVVYLLIALGALCILVALGLLLFTCRKRKGHIELCLINEVGTVSLVNLWPESLWGFTLLEVQVNTKMKESVDHWFILFIRLKSMTHRAPPNCLLSNLLHSFSNTEHRIQKWFNWPVKEVSFRALEARGMHTFPLLPPFFLKRSEQAVCAWQK